MNFERHAFTNFTGKPYIHYNGVSFNKPRTVPSNLADHPKRSIIWPNITDNQTIEQSEIPYEVDQSMYPQLYRNCNHCANNFFK